MLKLGGPARGIDISGWASPGTKVVEIASRKPLTCDASARLKSVIDILAKRYRRIPVTDREGHVKGMLSTTDVLRALSKGGGTSGKGPASETTVRSAMSRHVIDIDQNTTLSQALEFFRKHRKGAYPVTHRKKLTGMVSEWDLVRQVRGRTRVKVADVMVRKPIVAQDRHTASDVTKMMLMGGFRRLPVVKDGILVGIVAPRDILLHLHESGNVDKPGGQAFPVTRIMSEPITVGPEADVGEVAGVMIARKVGGLPVVEDHELMGIVTERDIVDAIVI